MVKKIRQYNAEFGKRVIQGSDDTSGMVADDLSNSVPTDETPIGVDNQAGAGSPGSANPTVFHKPTCPPPPPPRKKRIFRSDKKAQVYRLFLDNGNDRIFTDDYDFPVPSNGALGTSSISRHRIANQINSWYYLDPTDGSCFFVNVPATFGGAAVMFATQDSQAEIDFITDQELVQVFGNGTSEYKLGWGMQGSKIVLALLPRDYLGDASVFASSVVTRTGSVQNHNGGGVTTGAPGGGVKLECYSLFNDNIPIVYTNPDATGETDDERKTTFPDGSVYEFHRINRAENQNTFATGGVTGPGLFFFCNPINAYSCGGSYGMNGTFTTEDTELQTGTARAFVLELDENDSYSRTQYTGNYSSFDVSPRQTVVFSHNGTFGSSAVFGTGFPSCPPGIQIGATVDSNSQISSATMTTEETLTSSHSPFSIPLEIDPGGNNENFELTLPAISHAIDWTYIVNLGNISPVGPYDVCTSPVIGGFFGGDSYETLNTPISPTSIWLYKNRSISEPTNALGNGTFPPLSFTREYPFVAVITGDGTPIWFDVVENWQAVSTVNVTTPPIWDFLFRDNIAFLPTGGQSFNPFTAAQSFFFGLQPFSPYNEFSTNGKGWRLGGRTFRWATIRPKVGYLRGAFSASSGSPFDRQNEIASATLTYTTSTTGETWDAKYGNSTFDHLDSLFLARLREDEITVNVTSSNITISKLSPASASVTIHSTRGFEPYVVNPSVRVSGGSMAPQTFLPFSTDLISSVENEANVINAINAQDWWVCIRDEGGSFPESLKYTLYDCSVSSITVEPRTSPDSNGFNVYDAWDTDEGWRGIQLASITFSINSERRVDHFPIPEDAEAVNDQIVLYSNTFERANVIATTKNMLALALQLRRYLAFNNNVWYLTNGNRDLQSDMISGNNGGELWGTKLRFNPDTQFLEFDSNFCYEIPAMYTNEDDGIIQMSKKLDLNGFKP